MHLIEEAFGKGCNLYEDVLSCPPDASKAQLRKSYYRAALKYHPDRNAGSEDAHVKFQALSLAYEILGDETLRQEYNETGVIPDGPDEDVGNGVDEWKQYFFNIFGRVSTDQIDQFAQKYKCSDEEQRDVLLHFRKRKGNLMQMMEYVMLSEPRDALRWMEDYIRPAIGRGDLAVDDAIQKNIDKSLQKAQQLVKKGTTEEDDDDEATTESEEDEESPETNKPSITTKKASPRKAKASKAKKRAKKKGNDMTGLIAQIQNKRSGGNVLASLGARYGVDMTENDPLSDADFDKARARLGRK